MGFAESDIDEKNLKILRKHNKLLSAFIVNSKIEASLISRCFNLDSRKIYIRNSSRCENIILNENNFFNSVVNQRVDLRNKKLILYAPTYRSNSLSKFFPFKDFDQNDFIKILEEFNAVILLRGHINEKEENFKEIEGKIIRFDSDICIDINEALNSIDLLITDYSSIYIDYLLLNRPIVFVPYDLEEYKETTGLLFDNYDYWTPGYKTLTYSHFRKAIKEGLTDEDPYVIERKTIKKIFFPQSPIGATCRNFELINKLINSGS
jgi:CDP-glycerol glycerophosphotransferase (TagB/SpsB family)